MPRDPQDPSRISPGLLSPHYHPGRAGGRRCPPAVASLSSSATTSSSVEQENFCSRFTSRGICSSAVLPLLPSEDIRYKHTQDPIVDQGLLSGPSPSPWFCWSTPGDESRPPSLDTLFALRDETHQCCVIGKPSRVHSEEEGAQHTALGGHWGVTHVNQLKVSS